MERIEYITKEGWDKVHEIYSRWMNEEQVAQHDPKEIWQ